MIRYQRTLKKRVSCEGIGLHSGKIVKMTIKPAPAGSGIVFSRTDLDGAEVQAIAANTAATSYATTLRQNRVSVMTVEHLLAAFAGLNIDNAYVEIDAEELPIMDGSARPFVQLIADAGIQSQEVPQPMLKVISPVFVREGDRQVAVWPAENAGISYFIDFNHPMLKEQSLQYQPSEEAFLLEVSDARTFGFVNDVKSLQANGLAKGASLDNAVALGEDSILNEDGLRYKDEFVRHKILDLLGDMFLVGMPIIGHIVAHKSGHGLNARMAAKLLASPESWVLVGSPGRLEVKHLEPQLLQAAL
ncbi:MAG TPA: UDP-3-O-acyl-N-acetylglucosamine deacetylase [Nitrospirota bacterium]|nr:UDP-3-O-acyl-N-acetylglucosamine deacetylase [Nitrospirota bacterium]